MQHSGPDVRDVLGAASQIVFARAQRLRSSFSLALGCFRRDAQANLARVVDAALDGCPERFAQPFGYSLVGAQVDQVEQAEETGREGGALANASLSRARVSEGHTTITHSLLSSGEANSLFGVPTELLDCTQEK